MRVQESHYAGSVGVSRNDLIWSDNRVDGWDVYRNDETRKNVIKHSLDATDVDSCR